MNRCPALFCILTTAFPFCSTDLQVLEKAIWLGLCINLPFTIIYFSPDAPFHIFNCAQYANNPELLSSNLFGHSKGAFTGAVCDTKGILAASDGGILFLDEVHRLNFENRKKNYLFFLDKGIFGKFGENAVWQKANVRIIMATTEDIHSSFLDTFIRRIPVIVTLPSLEDRGKRRKAPAAFPLFLS